MSRSFERTVEALQAAALAGAYDTNDMTEKGVQMALEALRAALPVAQSVLLLGTPLHADSTPIARHIDEKLRAIGAAPESPTDPDHECDKAAATVEARHFVGIAIGLLLADLV